MHANTNLNVLIVDDHGTMRRIIKNLLSQIGVSNTDEAGDGQDALHKLAKKKYDLILSDWNMMPMTGLEFLRIVRGDPSYMHQNVPFVMITAEMRKENVIEAKEHGVDAYLGKPFDAAALNERIAMALQRRAA